MKKAIVAIALAGFAQAAMAAIANGSHDLSTRSGALLSSCQFCHAPHNVNTTVSGAPLWNRSASTAGFTVYASNTLQDSTVALGVNSATCLSCHDGVSDMGATFTGSRGFAANTVLAGYAVVGQNLQNDHPVGVNYVPAANNFDTVANVTGAGLKLYGTAGNESVECASCHDPHGTSDGLTGGPSFLRVAATLICSECHLK